MIASLYQRGSSVNPKTSGGILAIIPVREPTGKPEIPDPALHSTLGAGGIRPSSRRPVRGGAALERLPLRALRGYDDSGAFRLLVDPLAARPGFAGTLSASDLKEAPLALDLKVTGSVCGTGDQRPVGGVCRL